MAMIISMKRHATREEIDAVTNQVNHFGYKVHSIEGEERVVIGVVGVGDVTACMESIEAMAQVENVMRISAPYKFVSKEFRKEKTQIRVNGTVIGGDEFVVYLADCPVESALRIMERIRAVVAAVTAASGSTVTASVGLALSADGAETFDDLVDTADRALLSVKRSGKDQLLVAETV